MLDDDETKIRDKEKARKFAEQCFSHLAEEPCRLDILNLYRADAGAGGNDDGKEWIKTTLNNPVSSRYAKISVFAQKGTDEITPSNHSRYSIAIDMAGSEQHNPLALQLFTDQKNALGRYPWADIKSGGPELKASYTWWRAKDREMNAFTKVVARNPPADADDTSLTRQFREWLVDMTTTMEMSFYHYFVALLSVSHLSTAGLTTLRLLQGLVVMFSFVVLAFHLY